MPQLPRSSRRQKIEPLDWAVAAQAPALRGMTSFLDVSAEDVRNGTFDSFGPQRVERITAKKSPVASPDRETYPGDETTPAHETSQPAVGDKPGRPSKISPIRSYESSPASDVSPELVSSPAYKTTPDVETRPSALPVGHSAPNEGIVPGRGRSKVRRCVLAQDGHSLGEEAIYQVMWKSGRPEGNDPNGSRTIRIGAADVGYKVNMAKKNVRQNISRLYEKLALEILEDFETISSQARLYRVFSYKQILERRRAAGLEYVLRNKGVVFCSKDGEELVSSPAYLSTPGDETCIRPAPPKKRRSALPAPNGPYSETMPTPAPQAEPESADLQIVVEALNRYWPVDQAAAVQLLRDCRRVRPDARSQEIAFFVREKLELARSNRNITNPTGLILATVPQSFAGSAFEDFRRRMERQAALAAEEQQRKDRERQELAEWLTRERETLETVAGDPDRPQAERDAAEKRLRQLGTWNA